MKEVYRKKIDMHGILNISFNERDLDTKLHFTSAKEISILNLPLIKAFSPVDIPSIMTICSFILNIR